MRDSLDSGLAPGHAAYRRYGFYSRPVQNSAVLGARRSRTDAPTIEMLTCAQAPTGVGRMAVVVPNWNGGAALGNRFTSRLPSAGPGATVSRSLWWRHVPRPEWGGDRHRCERNKARAERGKPGFWPRGESEMQETSQAWDLVVNPDVTLTRGTIPALVDCASRSASRGDDLRGRRLLNPDGGVQASARREPSVWTGLFGRSTLLTRFLPGNRLRRRESPALVDNGRGPRQRREVDWVSGACLMARRAAFEQVGLLDERFFLFWEDADWCRRHRLGGWQVLYVPAAVAVHRIGVSRAKRRLR